MGAFAATIINAFSGAANKGGKGLQDLLKTVNHALKLLKQPQLSALQVATAPVAAAGNALGSFFGSGFAAGGLMQIGQPGQAGRDSVPLNVGGTPIMVAPGEQVAVFNRHQLPIVNAALAPVGGLPGLFGSVTTPNYMAAGGLVPGFAGGGTLSYGQLEGPWDAAGGPKSLAPLAAAVAEAESGGRDVMQQGQPFATTGWGYWQITPGGPQYLDPMTDAREAVAKWSAAGHSFSPWTTYVDGAYKPFLNGAVPAAGGIGSIADPKVTGTGAIADIVRAGLHLATKAANDYLSNTRQQAAAAVELAACLPALAATAHTVRSRSAGPTRASTSADPARYAPSLTGKSCAPACGTDGPAPAGSCTPPRGTPST